MEQGCWLFAPQVIVRAVGATPALLFGLLLDYHEKHAGADGWFYVKNSQLVETLGISEHQLRQSFAKLQEANYLGIKTSTGAPNSYKFLETIYEPLKNLEGSKTLRGQKIRGVKKLEGSNILTPTPQNIEVVPLKNIEGYPLNILTPYKEVYNKELNKEENNNKEGDFLQNPKPTSTEKKAAKSKKGKLIANAEKIRELVKSLLQQFYPNTKKGWADLLNEYLFQIKASKSKSPTEDAFLKTCKSDAERFLKFCKTAEICDRGVEAFLEQACENAWHSLTKWGDEKANYMTKLKSFHTIAQNEALAGVSDIQDVRFTDPAYFNYFLENILRKYKPLGAVRTSHNPEEHPKRYFAVLVSKLSADIPTFGSELKDVAARLQKEIANFNNQNTGSKGGYKQERDFDYWLQNKCWEKITLITPKNTPILQQNAKNEQVSQIPAKAPISEKKEPLQDKVFLRDKEAEYPAFPTGIPEAYMADALREFTRKLCTVFELVDGKVLNFTSILRKNGVRTAGLFCEFLYEIYDGGFPCEADAPKVWEFIRGFYENKMKPLLFAKTA